MIVLATACDKIDGADTILSAPGQIQKGLLDLTHPCKVVLEQKQGGLSLADN